MLLDLFPKNLVDLNALFVTIVVPLVIKDLNALSFMFLKESKEKKKLELLGSCAKKGKPNLNENSMFLKKVFNALNFLSMCISGSHFSNPRLTSHETLIPKNRCFWMKKSSYGRGLKFFWFLI